MWQTKSILCLHYHSAKVPIPTKLDKVMTYFQPIKSYNDLITWYCKVKWQMTTIYSTKWNILKWHHMNEMLNETKSKPIKHKNCLMTLEMLYEKFAQDQISIQHNFSSFNMIFPFLLFLRSVKPIGCFMAWNISWSGLTWSLFSLAWKYNCTTKYHVNWSKTLSRHYWKYFTWNEISC